MMIQIGDSGRARARLFSGRGFKPLDGIPVPRGQVSWKRFQQCDHQPDALDNKARSKQICKSQAFMITLPILCSGPKGKNPSFTDTKLEE